MQVMEVLFTLFVAATLPVLLAAGVLLMAECLAKLLPPRKEK